MTTPTPTGPAPPPSAEPSSPPRYRLRLYVSGATSRSTQAILNIKAIGETRLHGEYDLEVVDAYQQADLIRDEQIVALPTLVKDLPLPIRRLVGDLSEEDRVLVALGLFPDTPDPPETAR